MDKVGEDGAVEIVGNEEEPSGHGIGRTEVSLWAFTKAFEPLDNQAEFVAASATLARFLRRHTKFKATCAYPDSSEVQAAWRKYATLEALLSPVLPFQNSFYLDVKTCGPSESEAMLKAAAWFFWQAMKQWHRTGKRPGTMLLRRLELANVEVAASYLHSNKLKSLLEDMHSIPGLPASPKEPDANGRTIIHLWPAFTNAFELLEDKTNYQEASKFRESFLYRRFNPEYQRICFS